MKPRLILTQVLAAVAILAAVGTPALAAKNDGRFQQSIENTNSGGLCTTYVNHYSDNLKKMKAAKDKQSYASAREEVNWAIGQGVSAGCSWVDVV